MKFVERDQTAVADNYICGQQQVVGAANAIVGDDVGIREQHDAAFAVRIINQQSASIVSQINDGRRRAGN